jgi:DNA primase
MIPASFISDLLARVDIVDVVGEYVKLKKGGANMLGLCPFHNEKSGSFTVSPAKQFYHCFGCGAHGTAIGFLMEYSGMSFPEAVRDLAQGVGMIVPEEERTVRSASPVEGYGGSTGARSLTEVMLNASNFYRAQLKQSARAIDYLKGRGLTGEIALRFALGYAPAGWTNLDSVFDDYHDRALIDAGLVIDREAEGGGAHRHYDRFRDRIMFPIRNTKGQVIGFGGRIIDQGEPKYLNSPETPLFQKGLELYGLFEARREIREAGFAIVVEGYMDVVALAQLGVTNAVATLGTACTTQHVQKLARTTDHVVFSFDGDAAGRRAAWRALQASLPYASDDKTFTFLFLPEEHDPDTYIREHGEEGFRKAVAGAQPLSAFLVQESIAGQALDTAEGRAHALHEAKPLLALLPAGMLRLQIVRELARLTRTSVQELTDLAGLSDAQAKPRGAAPKSRRSRPTPLEDQIMRLLLSDPSLAVKMDGRTAELLARHPLGALQELVRVCTAVGEGATLARISAELMQHADAELFTELISQAMAAPEIDPEVAAGELVASARKLRLLDIKRELDELARAAGKDAAALTRMRLLWDEQRLLDERH